MCSDAGGIGKTTIASISRSADRRMPSDHFTADKATIRAELERRARSRQVITYGEAAALVDGRDRGPAGS